MGTVVASKRRFSQEESGGRVACVLSQDASVCHKCNVYFSASSLIAIVLIRIPIVTRGGI